PRLGATELRIAAEPELRKTLDQVREPAMKEEAMASVITERRGVHCTLGEGELLVDLGLWEAESLFNVDLYADLPPLLPPSSEPSITLVPKSILERAPVPKGSPESPEAHKCLPSHLHPSGCASSLWLHQAPPSLRLHLCPLLLWLHCGLSDPSLRDGRRNHWFHLITLAHWLSVSTSGSSPTCSATISQPPGVVSPSSSIAPPSVGSIMGRHHGCDLGPSCCLLPGSCLHLMAPPVSSLALPWTLFAILLPGVRPPPEPTPKFPPSPPYVFLLRKDAPSGTGGGYITPMDCHYVCFPSHVLPLI
ncbi:hypothetical protein M9458_003024, partial [Cirrhinus mrigala]